MTENQIFAVHGVNAPKTQVGYSKMQDLLKAAERLFTNRGFFEVSVADICKEAHTAVGTFYIYFENKAAVYRCLVEQYKQDIKGHLAQSIAGCQNRLEMEREGIKCFVRYSVANPNVYNIIWGSLAVDKQLFEEYYVSFAESYAKALLRAKEELKVDDVTSTAYMLMGITNFLGLRALFEGMDDQQIDVAVDNAVIPILEQGLFR